MWWCPASATGTGPPSATAATSKVLGTGMLQRVVVSPAYFPSFS